MLKHEWWFAPSKFPGGLSRLEPMMTEFDESYRIEEAESLTIAVEKVYVSESFDGLRSRKGKNDLIVTTQHRLADTTKLAVDKLHHVEKDVPIHEPRGPFFHPIVWATDDFQQDRHGEIIIRVRVYDEDGLRDSDRDRIRTVIDAAGSTASVAFPAFIPIAGLGVEVAKTLAGVVNRVDPHTEIIDQILALRANSGDAADQDILRPGYYICFDNRVRGEKLALNKGRMLVYRDTREEFKNRSYVVLSVERGMRKYPDYQVDEDAATLMSEINAAQTSGSGLALEHVRSTLSGYNAFKRLKRAKILEAKVQGGEPLSRHEKDLIDAFLADPELAPFLATLNLIPPRPKRRSRSDR